MKIKMLVQVTHRPGSESSVCVFDGLKQKYLAERDQWSCFDLIVVSDKQRAAADINNNVKLGQQRCSYSTGKCYSLFVK